MFPSLMLFRGGSEDESVYRETNWLNELVKPKLVLDWENHRRTRGCWRFLWLALFLGYLGTQHAPEAWCGHRPGNSVSRVWWQFVEMDR